MISLKVGEVYSLKVESNPSTGYSWTHTVSKSKIISISETINAIDPKLIGATNNMIFNIKGLKKGTVEVVFNYHKVWEIDTIPALTKKMTVKII
jgi:inhibitor of cysteine peptidase